MKLAEEYIHSQKEMTIPMLMIYNNHPQRAHQLFCAIFRKERGNALRIKSSFFREADHRFFH
jgi:hypothetical protein